MAMVIDAAEMRRRNKLTVLNAIRNQPGISRAALSEATGMNKATVSSLVAELMDERFVIEVGPGSSTGGRRPIRLQFHAEAAYSIGIDVQIHSVRLVLCNLNHAVVLEHLLPMSPASMSSAELVGQLADSIRHLLAEAPESPHGVIGIGISLPGLVNYRTGYIHYIPNMGIRDLPLAEILQAEFRLPVLIDNDANCGAWAIYRDHTAVDSLVFVNVGIGIGAGVIVNGQLYRGTSGLAGEYGHMTIDPMGLRCSCGNRGCWEQYASESALLAHWNEVYARTNPGLHCTGYDVVPRLVELAQAGDEDALRAFAHLGYHLGVGLANIANTLNPEMIVIGGRLAAAERFLRAEMEHTLRARALPVARDVRLTMAEASVQAVGAAGIVAEETLLRTGDAPAVG
ncbi:ROK family transcriptional regulator [Alicyclobacillus sp.]|uniref:ROK family transcriptional regulator n=1 Tax=Alicyclobacillus sp. TaxID=61169 RepID=UPI0025B92358|nr:ROK family transcriptional regulator [Alicyclobacillus sp.]MCL6516130.1 ROK family transcriptional regulator [Alicyclobacillus sp.]